MKSFIPLLCLSAVVGLAGCAQKPVETNLAAKVANEKEVSSPQELQTDASVLIERANLKPEQKANLKNLQAETSRELQNLREESLKMRSILIKDVFAKDYNKSEVELVQSKIKDLDQKRLAVMFAALTKANVILGHESTAHENEQLMDRLMLDR